MNCSQFCLHISPYLDAELSFTELKTFREHPGVCPPCRGLLARMEETTGILRDDLQVSLSPDFITRLQARLQAEAQRTPSWWRQLSVPRVMGFSPISLGGLAAAALALLVIGVSLFQPKSAPLVDPPAGASHGNPPAMIAPRSMGAPPAASSLHTTAPKDSLLDQRDSSRRDFSRQIKYVNKGLIP